MALANYADLIASVAAWSKRSDLTALMPDFVALAEARISRDLRMRRQVTNTTLTTAVNTATVALPTDWLESMDLTLATNPTRTLTVISLDQMDWQFPASITGAPAVYAVLGANIKLGPTPDAAYSLSLDYYAKFAGLQANSTNWLMTNHPNIYLSACLAELALYTFDERATLWMQKYQGEAQALQDQDDAALYSGSVLRVRTN